MKRRRLLATLTPFLAGCSSKVSEQTTTDGQTTTVTTTAAVEAADSGPPHFEQVKLSAPDTVTVNEDFHITVSAANTGGRTGDFTTTLTFGSAGGFSTDVGIEIPDVASGERKQKQFGPYHLDTAGDYTVRITDHAISETITGTPLTASTGESVAFPNGLTVSIDGVRFQPSFFYKTDSENESKRVFGDADTIFVILDVSVSNESSEKRSVPQLAPVHGTAVRSFGGYNTDLSILDGIETPLAGHRLTPGDSTSGSLLYKHPYAAARQSLTYTWDYGSTDKPEARFAVPPSSGSSRSIPEFTIDPLNAPGTAFIGSEVTISATVSNVGDEQGIFRGEFQYKPSSGDRYKHLKAFSREIPAGKSTTITLPIWEESTGEESVRLYPFTKSKSITYTEPALTVGDTYTMPWLSLTVTDVVDSGLHSYQYKVNGSKETESDSQFLEDRAVVFAYVKAKNRADTSVRLPSFSDFSLSTVDDTVKGNNPWANTRPKAISPVEGWLWRHPGEIQSGEIYEGWVPFWVPTPVVRPTISVIASIPLSGMRSIDAKWNV